MSIKRAAVPLPLLLLLLAAQPVLTAKLNTPRVLLPYNFQNNPVSFRLEVSDTASECFSWSSMQEEAVSLEPDEASGCSRSATVTAVSRLPSTQKVIVLAENAEAGVVLRCDVIVDVPTSLVIATTTREIYVEEAAEQFEVVAYDAEGNQFSSLDGVAIQWMLKGAGAAPPVVRIQPFSESSYDTTQAIEALESRGLRGDKVLLVGAATGTTQVTAHLQHKHIMELSTTPVLLSSVANLMLLPPDVYVLPGTHVPYTAAQVKHSRLHNINLDRSPYFLEVKDQEVAVLEKNQRVLSLAKGSTEVHLRDENMDEAVTGAAARLHVVEPASLSITSPSHPDWVAVTGQPVRLQSHLWDERGNKLTIAENVVIQLTVDEDLFHTDVTVANGSYAEGATIATGHAKVRAVLSGYMGPYGAEVRLRTPLVATSILEVYPPLEMVPRVIVLPWNPQTQPNYQIQLNYTGGDGAVTWSSSNSQLGTVSQQGLLRTRGQGQTTVTVSMARNPRIQARAQVYVIPVAGVHLIPGVREAEVGHALVLAVALHGLLPDGTTANFTRCHRVALDVHRSNDRFAVKETDLAGDVPAGGCRLISLVGSEPGHARVTVRLSAPWVTADAAALVGAYHPLTVVAEAANGLLLAPRSAWRLLAKGGPLPWPTRPSKHYSTADTSSSSVSVEPIPGSDSSLISWVQCVTLGQTRLHLTVGNSPSSDLPYPAVSTADLPVTCRIPTRLRLHSRPDPLPAREQLDLPACPHQSPLRAHAGHPLPLQLTCLDEEGRVFHNASSLKLTWSESSGGALAELVGGPTETDVLPYDWRTLRPAGREGDLNVRVALSVATESRPRLQTELPLRLVSPPKASPPSLIVFNHPSSREQIRLVGGSGHVAVRAPTPAQAALATCLYHAENATVQVTPLVDGQMTLEVWDLCLSATPPAVVAVQISGVTGVELSVVSRLAVGASTQAHLTVLGAGGRRLPARLLPLLNVRLTPSSAVLAVRYSSSGADDTHVYDVRGETVGDSALTARAGLDAAAERRLEVFARLRLSPRNRTVPVGSVYQLVASGGPRADAEVRYSVSDEEVAEVSTAGLVTASSVGPVTLTGRLSDWDAGVARHTLYSEDSVEAHVVQVCGVRLRAPLSRLLRGRRQPVYADGLDHRGEVFTITSPPPGVAFRWSSAYPQTAALHHPLSQLCITSEDGVAMRMLALEPGKAQVSVQLEYGAAGRPAACPAHVPTRASLHITVYEELLLISPPARSDPVLMAPHSSLELDTSVLATAASDQGMVVASGRHLRAGARSGRDLVTLTSEGHENQTLALPVEVLPVAYVMMTPIGDVCVRPGAIQLPSGMTVHMNVTAHDSRGRVMSAWQGVATPVASRGDLLQTAGAGQHVQVALRRAGAAAVTVTAVGQTAIADTVFFSIGDLLPDHMRELTVGQVTCLPTPLTSGSGGSGQWQSDDPSTAQVISDGALAALRPGTATLTLALTGGQQARVPITIHPVTEVSLSAPVSASVSACRGEPFSVPLSLSSAALSRPDCADALLAAPAPALCKLALSRADSSAVSADRLFQADAVYDAQKGGHQCRLTALCPTDSAAARLTADLLLTAEVPPSPGQPGVTSDPIRLLLVPPVHLETAELRLGGPLQTGEVALIGAAHVLQSVTAAVSHSQLMQTSAPRRDGDRLRVPVSLRPAAWSVPPPSGATVTLSVPASGQTLTVPVLMSPAQGVWQPPPAPPGWAHVLALLASQYWSWMSSTLMALGAATLAYLFVRQLRSSSSPPPVLVPASPPPQYGSPTLAPYSPMSSSAGKVHLWTDDTGPIYGSPTVQRRSPYFEGDRSRSSPCESDRSRHSPLMDRSFR